MSEWLERTLEGSILELRGQGMTGLADDLHRLLSSGEVENLRLYRNAAVGELAHYLDDIQELSELQTFLHHLVKVFEVDHFTLHCCNQDTSVAFVTRVITTYPKSWVTTYVNKSYSRVDPILIKAEESAIGFYWDEVDFSFPPTDAFRRHAEAEGIGPSGYTLPLSYPRNLKIACSLTSGKSPEAFRESFARHNYDLRLIMEALGEVFFNVAGKPRKNGQLPSDLVCKFMSGLARGDTPEQIQNRLKINDVDTLIEGICELYGAKTLWQALVECIQRGHLDDRPFDLVEIHH